MRAATWLRWVHLGAGVLMSVYITFQPADGWGDPIEVVTKNALLPFVAWTGIIRWQLPRYRAWRARRRGAVTSS